MPGLASWLFIQGFSGWQFGADGVEKGEALWAGDKGWVVRGREFVGAESASGSAPFGLGIGMNEVMDWIWFHERGSPGVTVGITAKCYSVE